MIAHVDTKTRELFAGLSVNNPVAENAARDWYRMFPESVYRVAGAGLPPRSRHWIYALMTSDAECCRHLCDPLLLDAPAAISLAKSLLTADNHLDMRLARAAAEWGATPRHQKPLHRCLEILDAITSGSRINSSLVKLLHAGNGTARSKIVGLLVRSATNEANIREWLRDPDPRIQANVLESLSQIGPGIKWIREVLLEHLSDPEGRVCVNAAIGLYRMGLQAPAVARLTEMASSEHPALRCSAAWAIGQIPDPKLYETLNRLRADSDQQVKWHALKSLTSFTRAGVKPKEAAPVEEPRRDHIPAPVDSPAPPPQPPTVNIPEGPVFNTRTFGRLL